MFETKNKRNLLFMLIMIIVIFSFLGYKMLGSKTIAEENLMTEEVVNVKPSAYYREIYYFYQPSCYYCEEASRFLKENHPDLKINRINIREKTGRDLFFKFAKRYTLDMNQLGTPLITLGNKYIMGWGEGAEESFNEYLEILNNLDKE